MNAQPHGEESHSKAPCNVQGRLLSACWQAHVQHFVFFGKQNKRASLVKGSGILERKPFFYLMPFDMCYSHLLKKTDICKHESQHPAFWNILRTFFPQYQYLSDLHVYISHFLHLANALIQSNSSAQQSSTKAYPRPHLQEKEVAVP